MQTKIYFQIDANSHRLRLDDFLFDEFYSLSKMYLREVIKEGNCEVNGYTGNSGIILKTKDFVEIEVDLDRETAMRPEAFPLDIVYEEESFLLVNKPPEMLVHPTHRDKNGTLLNALSHYLNQKVLLEILKCEISTGSFACSPMLMASSIDLTTSVPSSRMWLA